MTKEFFIQVVAILTYLSGAVAILSAIGWFLGAEDALSFLLISVATLLLCGITLSLVKDGWTRFVAFATSTWPF
jgi:hypothetical protein